MDFCETSSSRFATILTWIQRFALPWLLIALWCIGAYKYGFMATILVGGFLSALITLPIALYKGVLVPLLRGVQCPYCGEWGLVRVACISFGYRFYRCDHCKQRCKRLEYNSPWVDSSGMEDDDMYKPIHFFGPARKREASICALKALGTISAAFLFSLLGWLIGGERGCCFGSVVGAVIVVSITQRDEKKIIPIAPVLWDREIDE